MKALLSFLLVAAGARRASRPVVVLRFETAFANKRIAIETVTPFLEKGAWRVSGYYVR